MRDHYHGFSHPVLLELPPEPTMSLFGEMDAVADELRGDPRHTPDDDQLAFRQLQRARLPDLSEQEWLDLFDVWRDHYRARLEAQAVARSAHMAKLWEERDALLTERASLPPAAGSGRVDARLREIGNEIAA